MWWPLLRFRFESFPFPFKIKRKWRVNLYFNWLEQALSQAPGSSLPHFTWEMDYVISSNSNMINAVAKNELSDQHQEHDQNCHQQDHQHNKKHQHRHNYEWPNDYQMLVFYHQQSMINSGQYKTRRNMGHQVFAEELCVVASSWVSLAMAVPQCAPEYQSQTNKITFFQMSSFNCTRKKRNLRSWSLHDFRNGVTMRRSPLTILKVFLLNIILVLKSVLTWKVWDWARCRIRNPSAQSRCGTPSTPSWSPTWTC